MIVKTVTNLHVTLEEAKEHLRLENDFIKDNNLINDIINAAHEIAENEISKDIAKKAAVLTLTDFAGGVIEINSGNLLSITSILVKESETPLTNYNTYIYNDSFKIDLDTWINTDELTVNYISGYDVEKCPPAIKIAIKMKIADLYDLDRASGTLASVQRTNQFERILAPYKAANVIHKRES